MCWHRDEEDISKELEKDSIAGYKDSSDDQHDWEDDVDEDDVDENEDEQFFDATEGNVVEIFAG